MNNPLYIPLEQDLVKLKNQINSINNLINHEAFKSYGKYAHYYVKNYNGFNGNISRMLVHKTMRNAIRVNKNIVKKIQNIDDIKLTKEVLKYSIELTQLQLLLI